MNYKNLRDIRNKNFIKLTMERGSLTKLSQNTGKMHSYFSMMRVGKTPISDEWARKIEKILGAKEGYLDQPINSLETREPENPYQTISSAKDWLELYDRLVKSKKIEQARAILEQLLIN